MVRTTVVSVVGRLGLLAGFVAFTVAVRGLYIAHTGWINPDEAELMAQARAAMFAPLPFTEWTTATTGPFWVLFLAVLGWIGLPLTLSFAHLLAAVLVGIIGFVGWIILSRSLGPVVGSALAVGAWLPLALVYPLGSATDFAALSTELLPAALVLGAAAISARALITRPWLFAVAGVLCGLAIGAKYQVLPIALALLAVQVIQARLSPRQAITPIVLWMLGGLVPFLALGLAMVLSGQVSAVLIEQNLNFLGAYAQTLGLDRRFLNTATLIAGQPFFLVAIAVLFVLAWRSEPRVLLGRVLLVSAGGAAVFAGGMGFPHYLILLNTALVMAAALPARIPVAPLSSPTSRWFLAAAVAIAVLVTTVASIGRAQLTGFRTLAASVSPASVQADPDLARVCPSGDRVMVWGWAPELYVHYGWRNAFPIMNSYQLTSTEQNYESGLALVQTVLEAPTTSCVIDAVGEPFFGFTPEGSLTREYPQVRQLLEAEFREVPGLIDCQACSVYVRD